MGLKEFEFIDWIRSQNEDFGPDVLTGPGDDCAVVSIAGQAWLITTDQLIDGVHFDLAKTGARLAGRKSLARALSDIAAMGGSPVWSVATVSLPDGFTDAEGRELYLGRREVSDEFGCPMIGGDVAVCDGPMSISITVLGKMDSGVEPVLRSGAKVGDCVCVTGDLGGSWLTSRHLEFSPRIREGKILAASYPINSMIDISDGLVGDLGHICKGSAVGTNVFANQIPIHPDALAGRENITPLQAALGDGEDYELLFTLPQHACQDLLQSKTLSPTQVSCIGNITDPSDGMTLTGTNNKTEPLTTAGWEHHA